MGVQFQSATPATPPAATKAATRKKGNNDANAANDDYSLIKAEAETATVTNPAQSATVITLLAENKQRVGFVIENSSADQLADLHVKFGAGATISDYTRKLKPGEAWDRPLCPYVGAITGIWSAAGAGNARVTEEVL